MQSRSKFESKRAAILPHSYFVTDHVSAKQRQRLFALQAESREWKRSLALTGISPQISQNNSSKLELFLFAGRDWGDWARPSPLAQPRYIKTYPISTLLAQGSQHDVF